MRITSGMFKSRIIKRPKHIRPTQDKVRKALFDILQTEINNSCFLELFAGSGAVGIEALSCGAKEVIFVENDNQCCKIIGLNLAQLVLKPKYKNVDRDIAIFSMDTLKAVEFFSKKSKKFDIIFLDPPYYKELVPRLRSGLASAVYCDSLAKKTLQKLSAYDILAPHGLIAVEHNKIDILDENFGILTCFKQKRYGDTVLSFYRKKVSL